MYAKIESKDVKKARIILTEKNFKDLCNNCHITYSVAYKYLQDVFNENISSPKRNEVLVAAINEYGGKLQIRSLRKEVVVIDENDEPENHLS